MGLRLGSPICIHRSQFLSLLSLFMQSCSIHLLCSLIFPIHKPTINCSLTSSAVSGMDPQAQPVVAKISELLAIRKHLRDTGYRNVYQVAGGLDDDCQFDYFKLELRAIPRLSGLPTRERRRVEVEFRGPCH